jgi:hypothetical protein
MFGKEPEPQPNLFATQSTFNTPGFGPQASPFGQQPQTSNSVFGTASTFQPQSQSAFGAPQSPVPQQSGGLFSVSQPQSEPQPSSFGSIQAQAKPASSTFSFSAPQSQVPQQSGGLFGVSQPQSEPQPSSFGSIQAQAKPASSTFSFSAPQKPPQETGFGSVGGFGAPASYFGTTPNPGIFFGNPSPASPFGLPNPHSARRYQISPYNPARKLRNYSYYITIENSEFKADAHIIINSQDHFKLSSALLSQNCEFFGRELKSKSELSIDLPTQSFIYEFFLYLNYRYAPDLLDKITSFQDILDLYILLHKFEYKYAETLLDSAFSKIPSILSNPLTSYFPKELHRDYISFDFCIRLARHFSHSTGIFGTPFNFSTPPSILAYLLIWLGFDAIKSRQELSDLLDSEDCQRVKEYIELYDLYPNDSDQLNNILSRFPEAIFILNHDKLLKKIRVV